MAVVGAGAVAELDTGTGVGTVLLDGSTGSGDDADGGTGTGLSPGMPHDDATVPFVWIVQAGRVSAAGQVPAAAHAASWL